jgi:hypothetical protein
MPSILYRCVFCESSHEVARRAEGPVYLRCPTTYQWAWYDVAAFESAGPNGASAQRPSTDSPRKGARAAARTAGGTASARRRARPKASGRRALVASGAKSGTARRAGRRSTPRASARKSRKGGRR